MYSPPYDYETKFDDELPSPEFSPLATFNDVLPSPEFSPLKPNKIGLKITKTNNNYVCDLVD